MDQFLRSWLAANDWDVRESETWIHARPRNGAVPPHGWKLHISARPSTLHSVANLIVPLLAAEGWMFKVASSRETLRRLNDGITSPASVGKAFTVYPPSDEVERAGTMLAGILTGAQGPRILSDRRITQSSPVYYRYGPFQQQWKSDKIGRLNSWIQGPDGSHFDALATLDYRQPAWVTDPFSSVSEASRALPANTPSSGLFGERYRSLTGLAQSSRGNLFRALDERDHAVVIKQGRAFVGEDSAGHDVRMRLRNERRILQALEGIPRIPRFVDHFSAGEDEYLVMTDVGEINLSRDVRLNGLYIWDPSSDRSFWRLGRQLAETLLSIHARGVIVRDLSPKNVVLNRDLATIVDFGTSSFDGLHLHGSTLGYAAPGQLDGRDPQPEDDAYSLGLTLLYAATGLDPAPTDSSELGPALVRRALDRLDGHLHEEILEIVEGLVEQRPGSPIAAIEQLVDVRPQRRKIRRPSPTPPSASYHRMTETLVDSLVEQASHILTSSGGGDATSEDASYYSGLAGIGWELLRHPHIPKAVELATRLGHLARKHAIDTELPPGLFVGCTGVEIFLRELDSRGYSVGFLPDGQVFGSSEWRPEGHDLFVGSSGIALGHLVLSTYGNRAKHLKHVYRLADSAVSSDAIESPYEQEEDLPDTLGLDSAAGFAHGTGGLTMLLAFLADHPRYREIASRKADELAQRAEVLVRSSSERSAVPLASSWCRGLAGIALVLAHTGGRLGQEHLTALAMEAATIARTRVPRLSTVSQCCGLAGIGSLFLHIAHLDGGDGFAEASVEVAAQINARNIGRGETMKFGNVNNDYDPSSWAAGTTGLLAYVRAARDRVRPELFPGSDRLSRHVDQIIDAGCSSQITRGRA